MDNGINLFIIIWSYISYFYFASNFYQIKFGFYLLIINSLLIFSGNFLWNKRHKNLENMKKVAILLVLGVFLTVSCEKKEQEPQVSNVDFTPCKQEVLKSSKFSGNVEIEFTNKGVQITHYNFAVTCDFTNVNVTHTFVNGVLNITQQGYPNQANCVCHTDVSYTISGIAQSEVNVIFINGVQVYCHNVSDSENICLYLNSENIDKTIPIINEFLEGLPSSNSFSEDEQNLQALTEWLKSNSCVIDATILCVSCIYTYPAQSEISFSFKEGAVTKEIILDIIMTNPLKAKICSIKEKDNGKHILYAY